MGFFLSILYFVTYYFTPVALFGPLAAYHIELIFAVLITLLSLPKLSGSFIFKASQSLALLGLALAVFLSVLIGGHWVGGALNAFLEFIPNIFGFFMVCLHCNTKKKLQVLILMMLFVCLFVIANGSMEMYRGISQDGLAQSWETEGADPNALDALHPYLLVSRSGGGESIYRLRGRGLINDPNDFGQLIVCVIPLIFIFWRPKRVVPNIVYVAFPVCALLFGVFLTHSRGALLALIAVIVVATWRRVGKVPALLIAGGLYAAAMAMHFTGGRDISASAGEDRTALWGQSLQLLKSHPLFGIGYGALPDYLGLTAHNSVALCASELGSFGLFFWCLFLFPTVRDALVAASPRHVREGAAIAEETEIFPSVTRTVKSIDKAEINRLGQLMLLSLIGFLVSSYFLSRAYVMTLFILGGMAQVVYEMADQRGMIIPRMRLVRALPYSGMLAVLLVILLYIMLRIVNLMH